MASQTSMPAAPRPPARPPGARRARTGVRVSAGLIALACLALLGVAAWLEPAAGGVGTHTQLGLSPCFWASLLERPCPTCGMTTAFAHAADGNLAAGLAVQPAGFLGAVGVAAAFWASLHVAATGSNLARWGGGLTATRTLAAAGASVLAAWAYKLATWSPS